MSVVIGAVRAGSGVATARFDAALRELVQHSQSNLHDRFSSIGVQHRVLSRRVTAHSR
jgi:hypothetical protein